MQKNLYKKPIKRKKELLFYVCRIGYQNPAIIISSTESQYWHIRDKLQDAVDVGVFDTIFSNGQVFCERVYRSDQATLTDYKKEKIVELLKKNFHATTFDEIVEATRFNTKPTLEEFMQEDEIKNDAAELQKVIPLQQVSKEEYFYHAISARFPEFARKLTKEHKTLSGKEMEIE